jgi:hypothetical protein
MFMKFFVVFVVFFFTFNNVYSQGKTDIHVFDLKVNLAEVKIDNHKQITQQLGYENQAHFLSDGLSMYYAAVNESGLTDIYQYDLNRKKTRQLTDTFLYSEYSPTPTPDGQYFSCIRQGADGSQNLVMYPKSGGDAIVLIDTHLIGYHIWLDTKRLLTFVLNKTSNDMYLHDLSSGSERILSTNIGRCFKYIPNSESISYIQLDNEGFAEIRSLDTQTLDMSIITKSIDKIQDYAWLSEDLIVLAKDSDVFTWSPKNGWVKLTSLSKFGLKGITRIAVNPQRTKIAFISEE